MMEALDMSLDDIIKNNKKSVAKPSPSAARGGGNSRPRGRGHGRGLESGPGGPTRRIDNRLPARSNPYVAPPQAYYVQELGGKTANNSEAGTKLYISNLHYEVTNEDIKVLFSDVGELKRYSVHYDKSGRSKGTAEVVYMRQTDAVAAMKRYNNVQLDGQPMVLELVGVNILTPVPIPPMQNSIVGNNPTNAPGSLQGRIVGRGQERGGNNGNHGTGRGRPEKISAKDLDADLESFQGKRIVGRGQERGGNKGNQGSGKGCSRPQTVSAKDLDADLDRYRLQAMRIK
uniref:THO complex subunit 4A-like n=1 Tax=Erigeron canadensis TaxID=72917 RepID=UPI001CB8CCA2|nr:THO complex subunit 4A-like [Erigeron canadensis]